MQKVMAGTYDGSHADLVRIDASTNSMQCIDYEHHEVHDGSAFHITAAVELGVGGTFFFKLVTADIAKWPHMLWDVTSSGIVTITIDEDATGGMAGGSVVPCTALNRNTDCWTGVQDGGDDAAIMTDSTASFTADALIGYTIFNVTDGSSAVITDNDSTTVTGTLSGGTDNDWDDDDVYEINKSRLVITSGTTVATAYRRRIYDVQFGSKGAGGSISRGREIIFKQNTVYNVSVTSGTASNIISWESVWYEHTDKH